MARACVQRYGTTSRSAREDCGGPAHERAAEPARALPRQTAHDRRRAGVGDGAIPLHLLEVVMPCTGAGRRSFSRRRIASRTSIRPAWVLELRRAPQARPFQRRTSSSRRRSRSARRSAMAGLAPKDVTLAEIYDCYTSAVLIRLGTPASKKGEGGPFLESRPDVRRRLSAQHQRRHAVVRTARARRRHDAGGGGRAPVMGRAARGRSSRNDVAFVHGNGGTFTEECSVIFGKDR